VLRLLLIALLAAAGCAAPAPALTPVAATPPARPDPAALLGWWRVPGTGEIVLVDPTGIEVRAADESVFGRWRADPDGRFLVAVEGGTTWLAPPGAPAPAAAGSPDRLTGVAGFRVEGDDRVLLDRAGRPLARLVPEPRRPVTDAVDPAREPTAAERRAFGPAAPVPAPLRPAAPAELVGHWFPEGATNAAALRFDDGGAWEGSDGCNPVGGTWLAGPDGGFLAAAPAVRTLVFCEGGADVATQLDLARRVALDGPDLVLLDADATPVGRYYRASRAGTGPVTPP
jgi:META domain-containing protein